MKVAFYGNNLNQGYFFVRALREFGCTSKVFVPDYDNAQEAHNWWVKERPDESLIYRIRHKFNLTSHESLKISQPKTLELYKEVSKYDVLITMEDGPAVFSELEGIKKIFFSHGSDLQILPFLLEYHQNEQPPLWSRLFKKNQIRSELEQFQRNQAYWANAQSRQRLGIHQSDIVICFPNQIPLVRKLKYPLTRTRTLPVIMYTEYLKQVDEQETLNLERKWANFDILFLHPTRQMYLPLSNNAFLKDNDKLIRGFAHFLKTSKKKSHLLMIEKGRSQDIEASKTLISKLKLTHNVSWIPEIPNKSLRSYYSLKNVVICDQFNENLAILGNIGRESTFFGAPLITSFKPYNKLIYGSDLPPNVYPSMTDREIAEAMRKAALLTPEARAKMTADSKLWYNRNAEYRNVIPQYIDLLRDVTSSC